MSAPAVAELRGVVVRPGGEGSPSVLQGCSLSVNPGEKLVIVGESGSGKTTILRTIARAGRSSSLSASR